MAPDAGAQQALALRRDAIQRALAYVHHHGREPETVRQAALAEGLSPAELQVLCSAIHVDVADVPPYSLIPS